MKKLLIISFIIALTGSIWYFGTREKISETGEVTNGFKSFFPLGSKATDENTVSNDTPSDSVAIRNNEVSRFKQLSPSPIAGYSSFARTTIVTVPSSDPKQKPTNQTVVDHIVRYVSRQTGYVYEIKNEDIPLQITNTFIPAIYEAYFADDNNTAILRFLQEDTQTISSYSVPIPLENTDGTRTQKDGTFLQNNITSIAISPNTKEVLQLTKESSMGRVNSISSIGKNKKEWLNTPITELTISWPTQNTFYAQTKPASVALGYLYKINQNDKKLRKVLGDVTGLTASVSPSGNLVLYSESIENGFVTKILNTKTGVTKNIGLKILPEKCVWLKNEDLICAGNNEVEKGTYPDSWYAGLLSFSDQLFRIYTQNNVFDVLYDGIEKSFDITSLQLDETRNIIFFIDKNTGLLWQTSL